MVLVRTEMRAKETTAVQWGRIEGVSPQARSTPGSLQVGARVFAVG